MSVYEIIAVLTGLISVILTIYKSYWSWIIGLVSIFLYMYVFYEQKLFVNSGLQIVFALQSVHGLFYWLRNRKRRGEDVSISMYKFDLINIFIFLLIFIVINLVLMLFFSSKLDCITSTLSIVATLFMARGKIENWLLWMIADILYIIMFFQNGLYLSSFLYLLFFIICFNGYEKWKENLN